MKKINVIIALLVISTCITSCTDGLSDLNNNSRNITEEQLKIDYQHVGSKYRPIFENIYQYFPVPSFQLQQNLNADLYSGYMAIPNPFRGGANNSTYNLVSGWNNVIWSVAYSRVMNNIEAIKDLAEEEFPTLNAVALILKVEAMHRVSDIFGPIVYTYFEDLSNPGVYDSQQAAYDAFFADLDTAVAVLMKDLDNTRFKAFDRSYEGAYRKWVVLANSLRLRLAIRISKVDPDKAKTEGEKALSQSLGVMTYNADGFFVNGSSPHPLQTINFSWNDIRMNASMESILVGYSDPRGSAFFDNSIATGKIKGIRGGLPLLPVYSSEAAQKEVYVQYSPIKLEVIKGTRVQLMTAAEVAFLKAEAALRGWAGAGDAEANYEQGIRLSFQQHSVVGLADYIADNTSTPSDYVDTFNPSNNIKATSTITIAWDPAASKEEKLEKIITQKWIAMFPEGQEAWSEFRRTGYPKIFPVVSNQSAGSIDTNIQIRRIPFVDIELSRNKQGVENAVKLLKGPDNGGTRLWWDTGGPNF